MREAGVWMMRIANRFRLSPAEHERVEDLVFEIDRMIGDRAGRYALNQADRETVHRYAGRGWDILRKAL